MSSFAVSDNDEDSDSHSNNVGRINEVGSQEQEEGDEDSDEGSEAANSDADRKERSESEGEDEHGEIEEDEFEDGSFDDDEEGEVDERVTVEEHMEQSDQTKQIARVKFFNETIGFDYKGTYGEYHIRAFNGPNGDEEVAAFGYEWPNAYCDEDRQPLHAVMWVKEEEGYELISVWSYDAVQYYLDDFNNEDMEQFFQPDQSRYSHIINDDVALEHFACSNAEAVEEFFCPALDFISSAEMKALRAGDEPTHKRQRLY